MRLLSMLLVVVAAPFCAPRVVFPARLPACLRAALTRERGCRHRVSKEGARGDTALMSVGHARSSAPSLPWASPRPAPALDRGLVEKFENRPNCEIAAIAAIAAHFGCGQGSAGHTAHGRTNDGAVSVWRRGHSGPASAPAFGLSWAVTAGVRSHRALNCTGHAPHTVQNNQCHAIRILSTRWVAAVHQRLPTVSFPCARRRRDRM
jgi:hypothetical protein